LVVLVTLVWRVLPFLVVLVTLVWRVLPFGQYGSRSLYANCLGGSLNLVSFPGFGTHAYVFFPRLNNEQVEMVPDKDHPVERRNANVM